MSRSQKAELRRRYLAVRENLTDKEVSDKSKRIIQQLFSLPVFQQAEDVHTYLSIKKNKEVDTSAMVTHCFDTGKNLIIPKVERGGQLSHHRLNDPGDLKLNKWEVPETKYDHPFPVEKLDLIIVPVVCGDLHRNRIGYGKGYYDRFLSKTDAFKIGLLYDCTVTDEVIPAEPFDQKPDVLITESRIIR